VAGEKNPENTAAQIPVDDTEEEEDEPDVWWEAYINKGDLSNLLTFLAMVTGFVLTK